MRLPTFRTFSFLLAALFTTLLFTLSGCGFELRGSYSLPYESIYVEGPDYSLIIANIKRAVRNSGSTRLAETRQEAQAIFIPNGETRAPEILSLSSSGRVREKRLRYTYGYRLIDQKGRNLIPPGSIELTRDLTYADSAVLAKEQEEELLWRDMENDLITQLMRRFSGARISQAEGK